MGVQGRMGWGMGSLGCRAPDLRGKGSHGAQTASLEPSWAWSLTLERQQFVEPCRVDSGKSLAPTVTETCPHSWLPCASVSPQLQDVPRDSSLTEW